MERFPCWTPVGHADLDQYILRGVLGVLDKHIEIGIVSKDTPVFCETSKRLVHSGTEGCVAVYLRIFVRGPAP